MTALSPARRFLAVGWKRLARRLWLARRPTSPKPMTGREFLAAVAAAGITFSDDCIEDLNETSGMGFTTPEERRAAVTLPPPHEVADPDEVAAAYRAIGHGAVEGVGVEVRESSATTSTTKS